MNKKGAELTVATIVIVVLALIVLVVLVLGFTGGWGNLWERMKGFFGGSNVDSVIQACNVACTTQSKNDFCYAKRKVIFDDKRKITQFSCYPLWGFYYELGFKPCEEMVCDKLNCEEGYGGKWLFYSQCNLGWILFEDKDFAIRSGLTEKNIVMKEKKIIVIKTSRLELEGFAKEKEQVFEKLLNLASQEDIKKEDIEKETMPLLIYVSPEEREKEQGKVCCIVVDKV